MTDSLFPYTWWRFLLETTIMLVRKEDLEEFASGISVDVLRRTRKLSNKQKTPKVNPEQGKDMEAIQFGKDQSRMPVHVQRVVQHLQVYLQELDGTWVFLVYTSIMKPREINM